MAKSKSSVKCGESDIKGDLDNINESIPEPVPNEEDSSSDDSVIEKPKRKLSVKQLEGLARGRAKRKEANEKKRIEKEKEMKDWENHKLQLKEKKEKKTERRKKEEVVELETSSDEEEIIVKKKPKKKTKKVIYLSDDDDDDNDKKKNVIIINNGNHDVRKPIAKPTSVFV